jgi:hypothetical protein
MIGATEKAPKRSNPYKNPASVDIVVVDKYGNSIHLFRGQRIHASPDGDFQQVIGEDGAPSGDRMDRAGHPRQRDPAARRPHAHRRGVTTPEGNSHLPIETLRR